MAEPATVEIEIFRAGTAASRGLTEADLDAVVSGYDAAKAPAPLVKGHPSDDAPAFGVVQSVRKEGNRLFARISDVATEIVDGVRARRWLNRSAAFFAPDHPSNPTPGKLHLKHIGLLGAAAPAIAGMDALRFSADDAAIESDAAPDAAVIFAAALDAATPVAIIHEGAKPVADETPTFTAEDYAAAMARATAAEAALAANAAAAARAEHVAFADGMVAAGTLIPGAKDDLVAVFAALGSDVIEFSTDRKETPVAVLKGLLAGAKPVITFGAIVDPSKGADRPKTAADINVAARQFIASEAAAGRSLSFVAAVEHVTKEG